MEIFFKIIDRLHQTLPMEPHMPLFAAFQKVSFWRSRGPLGGPRGPGEVEIDFFQNL